MDKVIDFIARTVLGLISGGFILLVMVAMFGVVCMFFGEILLMMGRILRFIFG